MENRGISIIVEICRDLETRGKIIMQNKVHYTIIKYYTIIKFTSEKKSFYSPFLYFLAKSILNIGHPYLFFKLKVYVLYENNHFLSVFIF